MRAPALLCVGETMALVVPARAEPAAIARDFRVQAGGAESNVAVHAAVRGVAAAWWSRVGDDAWGSRITARIGAYGVDVSRVEVDGEAPTGMYVKDPGAGVRYYRTGSAASRMGPALVEPIRRSGARIVHLTGITPALSASCAALIDGLLAPGRPSGQLISFDVNLRPALWRGRDAASELRRLADAADIVHVGLDEAQSLWGCDDAASVRRLISRPRLLVVRDGGRAAVEFDGALTTAVAPSPVEVVEAVGAGDAFTAGYLGALLAGRSPSRRLSEGHEQATVAMMSTDDLPAVPVGRSIP